MEKMIDDTKCFFCGQNGVIHQHHLYHRFRNRTLTIPLCPKHHDEAHNSHAFYKQLIRAYEAQQQDEYYKRLNETAKGF